MPRYQATCCIIIREKIMDNVNQPPHYNTGEIECIQAIQASMTTRQFQGYLKGNVIKYMWRYEYKNQKEDLLKAQWYLARLLKTYEYGESNGKSENDGTPA